MLTRSAQSAFCAAFSLWFAFIVSTSANEPLESEQWQKVKEEDGIRVYQREVPGWTIKQIRATATIAAPLQRVKNIVTNAKQAGKINDVVSEAGVIRQDSSGLVYYFVVLDMPWPTTDRSAIYARKITLAEDGNSVTLSDKAEKDMAPTAAMKKTVRIMESAQEWELKALDDNTTDVTLTALTDPNGPIPAFLINAMSVDAPLKSIRNLRALAQAPR